MRTVLARCVIRPPRWLAVAAAVLAALLGAGCAARDERIARESADSILASARARLDEVRAALDASDAELAREKVAETLDALLLAEEQSSAQTALLAELGTLAFDAGDLAAAKRAQERVVEVRARDLPADHLDLQAARHELAVTLYTLGDLTGARTLMESVLAACSRSLPDDDPSLQAARQGLAIALAALGDLAGARALLERVHEICSRSLPGDDPDLQTVRSSLAITLAELGDLRGARVLFERVLEVRSRTLPDHHADLQAARQNLATTLQRLGEEAAARALHEKVLEVCSDALPDEHPDLQAARVNVAVALSEAGDHAGARELEEKVLAVRLDTLPADHPDVQTARGNLAHTSRRLGDLATARALEEQVLEARSRTLPDDHRDVACARHNLAVTLLELGDASRSRALALDFQRGLSSSIAYALLASTREAEERAGRELMHISLALSLSEHTAVGAADRELAESAFTLVEATRSAGLEAAALRKRLRGDPRARELFDRAAAASGELAQTGSAREAYEAALRQRDEAQRAILSLAGGGEGARSSLDRCTPQSVARALQPRQALVAFWRYDRTTWTRAEGEERLAIRTEDALLAHVLRSDAPPVRVELGPVEPIERAVSAWRDALGAGAGRGVSASHDAPRNDAASTGDRLRARILDPLLAALGECDSVLLIADDVLHLVAFDALPLDASEARLVGDRWRIEMRASVAELSTDAPPLVGSASLLAIGDVSYDATPAPPAIAAILRGGPWSAGFAPLPATAVEARAIGATFIEAFGASAPATLLARIDASRERLIDLAPRARFLHVATHGWFAPESLASWSDPTPREQRAGSPSRMSDEERVRGMSPMLLAGLALARANAPEDAAGRAPGLITAEELAALDLSRCELAVLSACDTARGEMRRAGQGVASLQRALQMAGARSVLTSLWRVPDEATQELMVDFYRRIWHDEMPKGEALWAAKTRLREARDELGRPRYSTRDWAAWVLTGEPR